MTFRVGLVGSGNISETHARAVVQARDVELVAHWGRNHAAVARRAGLYGGAVCESIDAVLAIEGLDAVLIGTPSGAHGEAAVAAARRGVHALVEKPLEITVPRVDEILAAATAAGTVVGVCFQDRTAPDLRWLKALIDAGRLGRPLLASASVRWYRPASYYADSAWRGTPELDGGGALMNQGIHTLDLLLWLLGDVRRVSAVAATAVHAIAVEDTVVATLEFASGALGTLEVTTAAFPGSARRLALTGVEGTIVVEGDRVMDVRLRDESVQPPGDRGSRSASAHSPVVSDIAGHHRLVEDFADAVRDGRAPACSGAEGRRSVALVGAIYRAAATGVAVSP